MDREIAPTILIVDDYDSVRIAISLTLKKNGFQVLTAEGPDAARLIWREHRDAIDLLLVDISMPKTSGPDLVRELLQAGPAIPVIFVTGTGSEQAAKATQHFSHPTILQKPFSPDVLVASIRKTLSRKSDLVQK